MHKYWLVPLLFIALPISTVSACDGWHYEAGVGKNTAFYNDIKWNDGNGIGARFAIRYETKHSVLQYAHISQYNVGPPFNNEIESSLDSFTWSKRW